MAIMIDNHVVQTAASAFAIGTDSLRRIESAFRYDLDRGIDGKETSSLKMLPSFIDLPTGREKGDVLALDFGGTNVRARLYHIEKGKAAVLRESARCLREFDRENALLYDYTSSKTRPEELFDFIAGIVKGAVSGDTQREYPLGWTFPSRPGRSGSIRQSLSAGQRRSPSPG